MTAIPEGLPTLASGAHKPGQGKACVMEYVALLAGESWTDSPSCTHPMLAEAARRTNDSLSDDQRHVLVPLIGRLFGTAETGTPLERKRLRVGLALWCADQVAHLVRTKDRSVCDAARAAGRAWLENPSDETAVAAAAAANAAYANAANAAAAYAANAAYAASYAAYADAAAANAAAAAAANAAAYAAYAASYARVEMLTGLIDEYDRLTGRTEHRKVTPAELTGLRDRVADLAATR